MGFLTAAQDQTVRAWDCSAVEESIALRARAAAVLNLFRRPRRKLRRFAKGVRSFICRSTGKLEGNDEEGNSSDKSKKSKLKIIQRAKTPTVLYALSGYKKSLSSIFANERKLVSDGTGSSVVVHSFDEDEEAIARSEQKQQEEQQEQDSDDFFSFE